MHRHSSIYTQMHKCTKNRDSYLSYNNSLFVDNKSGIGKKNTQENITVSNKDDKRHVHNTINERKNEHNRK